jgi:NACalpha-BTF3-like transcription factor
MAPHNYRTACLLLIAASLPVLAADSLKVKTGLWETTTTMQMSGVSMPADALAKMPPAQRTQMEQMMKQMGVGAPRVSTDRSCVTEKDLQEGAFRNAGEDMKQCKYTTVSATARHHEYTFQCAQDGHTASGRMVIDAADSTHVQGSADIKSAAANMSMKFSAQWLGASCAGADKN